MHDLFRTAVTALIHKREIASSSKELSAAAKGKASVKSKYNNKVILDDAAKGRVTVCFKFVYIIVRYACLILCTQNEPVITELNSRINVLWEQLLSCITPKCTFAIKKQNLKLMLERPEKFCVTDPVLSNQVISYIILVRMTKILISENTSCAHN